MCIKFLLLTIACALSNAISSIATLFRTEKNVSVEVPSASQENCWELGRSWHLELSDSLIRYTSMSDSKIVRWFSLGVQRKIIIGNGIITQGDKCSERQIKLNQTELTFLMCSSSIFLSSIMRCRSILLLSSVILCSSSIFLIISIWSTLHCSRCFSSSALFLSLSVLALSSASWSSRRFRSSWS